MTNRLTMSLYARVLGTGWNELHATVQRLHVADRPVRAAGTFRVHRGGWLTRDFVVEIRVRKPLGDVFAGERITHATMAILYGAMIANLTPVLFDWWRNPSALVFSPAPIPELLRWLLTLMGAGVLLSGLRDLYAALGLPGASWPWPEMSSSQK